MSLSFWCLVLGTIAVIVLMVLIQRVVFKSAAQPNSWAVRYLAKLEPQKWPVQAILFIAVFFALLILGQSLIIPILFKP